MRNPWLLAWGIWQILIGAALAQPTDDRLNLYIDCSYCDLDFFRTEISFVNHVRDRGEADVHLLITEQNTGGGGIEYSLILLGNRRFAGLQDTLRHAALDSDSPDMVRHDLLELAKIGLARFVAQTPAGAHLRVEFDSPTQDAEAASAGERWNFWVFEITSSSYFNGEKSFHTSYFYGDVSARRVTAATKIGLSVYGSFNRDHYDLGDEVVRSNSESEGFDVYALTGISDHWSVGGEFNVYRSTFSNRDLTAVTEAALEYNIFPYAQSTSRQLRLQYMFKHLYSNYTNVTIYDETEEMRLLEAMEATLEFTQPWGSAAVSVYGSHYFHDFKKNRLQIWANLSLRVAGGLSVTVSGNASRIRDLISLEKGEASDEEILLRRRQLETSYSYYTSIGLSYTFGSIYNNIVNPRFGD